MAPVEGQLLVGHTSLAAAIEAWRQEQRRFTVDDVRPLLNAIAVSIGACHDSGKFHGGLGTTDVTLDDLGRVALNSALESSPDTGAEAQDWRGFGFIALEVMTQAKSLDTAPLKHLPAGTAAFLRTICGPSSGAREAWNTQSVKSALNVALTLLAPTILDTWGLPQGHDWTLPYIQEAAASDNAPINARPQVELAADSGNKTVYGGPGFWPDD